MIAVHWVLIDLPVACVHNVAMLAPQNHATAVWDRVRHPDWLTPAQGIQLSSQGKGCSRTAPHGVRQLTSDVLLDVKTQQHRIYLHIKITLQCPYCRSDSRGSLEGPQLKALPHLEGFEAGLIPHAVLHHAPLDQLHGKASRVDGRLRIKRWQHL